MAVTTGKAFIYGFMWGGLTVLLILTLMEVLA